MIQRLAAVLAVLLLAFALPARAEVADPPVCWTIQDGTVTAVPCITTALPGNLGSLQFTVPECLPQAPPCAPERERSRLGEYLVRSFVGRGVDVTSGAIVFAAGGTEANKLQPTVEHRVGVSFLIIGAQTGGAMLIEKKWGHKKARLFSRAGMFIQFGLGAWNLGQFWKTQHKVKR